MLQVHSCADTPFNWLPDPIISEIFVLIWNSWSIFDRSWDNIDERCIPYVLAAVSRHWRTIALSTSKIWTLVDLSLRAEQLSAHLTRSKNLSLVVGFVQVENNEDNLRKLLQILNETNSWARMGHLNVLLNMERIGLLVDALNSATDADPIMMFRSIRIAIFGRDYGTIDTPAQLYLHIPQSQNLQSINLSHVSLPLIPDLPASPLPGLQYLGLEHVEVTLPDSLLPFLVLAPNLKQLTLKSCRVRSMPNTAAVAQPRHSIMLAKLEVLRLSNAEGVSGLNLLFRTLDMPQLLHLFLRTCSARPWTRLDWGAICYSRALRSLELEGFSSEALTGLLMHIELLSQLEAFRLLWSWLATPSEFAGQFACKLLETSYCPSLLSFNISFTLKDEHMETVKELRRARSSLCIFVRSDDSGYDDDDTAEEDELLGVENEGHVGNDSH